MSLLLYSAALIAASISLRSARLRLQTLDNTTLMPNPQCVISDMYRERKCLSLIFKVLLPEESYSAKCNRL